MDYKDCSRCKNNLSADSFYKEKRRDGNYYLRSLCKGCDKETRSKRLEEKKAYDKSLYDSNKDTIIERNKSWIANNKEHYKEYKRNYTKEKRKTETETDKLKNNLNSRIRKNIKKDNSTVIYLDTTIANVKKWLESNFKDDMNWDNYGKLWNIDHTIPIDVFDLTNEEHIFICFNWRNLMPMYSSLNSGKKNKIITELITNQEKICKSYCCEENTVEYFLKYNNFYNNLNMQNIS